MLDTSFVQLDANEEVLGIVRRSILAYWWKTLFAIVWLLLPFFFFYPLIKLGTVGFVLFIVLLASGVWNANRRRVAWYYSMFLITDRRIIDIDQTGVFSREVSELDYSDISEISVSQHGVRKLFGIGTVRVQTIKAKKFDLEISGVRNPKHVRDLLIDVQYMTGEYVSKAKSRKK